MSPPPNLALPIREPNSSTPVPNHKQNRKLTPGQPKLTAGRKGRCSDLHPLSGGLGANRCTHEFTIQSFEHLRAVTRVLRSQCANGTEEDRMRDYGIDELEL